MKLIYYYKKGNLVYYEYSNAVPMVTQVIDLNDEPHSIKHVYHYISALPGKHHEDDSGFKIPAEVFMVMLEEKA